MLDLRTFLLVATALPVVSCSYEDVIQVQAIAASQNTIIVVARNTEYDDVVCTPLSPCRSEPSELFLSTDGGQQFATVNIEGAYQFDSVVTFGGVFYALLTGDYDGYQGFTIESSTDGITWIQVAASTDTPGRLIASNHGVFVSHSTGVLGTVDGTTWVDSPFGSALHPPLTISSVVDVGDELILANGDGSLLTSSNDVQWHTDSVNFADAPSTNVDSVALLGATADRVIAVVTVSRNFGEDDPSLALDSFAPGDANANGFLSIGESAAAMVNTPAGLLLGDGSIITDATHLEAHRSHHPAFVAGHCDGQRVILADNNSIHISTDGGATFGDPLQLP